jgi:hypothetical protein
MGRYVHAVARYAKIRVMHVITVCRKLILGDSLIPDELHVAEFTVFIHKFMLYNC